MVNNVFAKRPFPRLLLAAAVVLLTLVLGTCQFIGADMFPTYLTRAEAVLDLRSELEDAGVDGDFWINRMDMIRSPATGKTRVYLRVEAISGGPALVILEGDDLQVVDILTSTPMVDFVGVDDQGYLLRTYNSNAIERYSPVTYLLVDAPGTAAPSFGSDAVTFSSNIGAGLAYYDPGTGGVYYTRLAVGSEVAALNGLSLSAIYMPNRSLRAIYSEGGVVRTLWNSYSEGKSFIVSYPSIALFESAALALAEDADAVVVDIPPSDDSESGWLTRDGAIMLDHDRDTRLTRYDADSGDELDYYVLGDTEETRIAFAPEGDRWLLFDGLSGKLHLLRTWW